ncbi:hypothetical protein KWH75_08215 [Morganella morganii]|uniref:hypothetical protein n=1 Tax=Morganella morganii TaxID=582 RepID=UPI0021D26A92|nr:hypothetical protein [Morganella morganii]MCU6237053.1 hypothetical protein [Morganella morganii]
MEQPKFIISAEPVCFVRSVTPLTPQIDISRIRTGAFCEPVFATISDDDIRPTEAYIAELQAQGVDKLADSIQGIYDALTEYHCDTGILITLRDEINRCRSFAEKLRSPAVQLCTCTSCTRVVSDSVMVGHTNLCDSCSEKLRGGCLQTCNQYPGSNGHD